MPEQKPPYYVRRLDGRLRRLLGSVGSRGTSRRTAGVDGTTALFRRRPRRGALRTRRRLARTHARLDGTSPDAAPLGAACWAGVRVRQIGLGMRIQQVAREGVGGGPEALRTAPEAPGQRGSNSRTGGGQSRGGGLDWRSERPEAEDCLGFWTGRACGIRTPGAAAAR
ncbi:hypothetical protein BDY21DRAFT_362995 [Lineolata rhizophorae]|uniref:Uncharacterized protein n=1 Tax=Lineolata rhizophorae TaxID=578093 RepID=A0A6A6P5S6_9PEZI|nr:hypothetical protein BDY21DRAFT_362995 [Lineolata rhizophorae]